MAVGKNRKLKFRNASAPSFLIMASATG